MGKEFRGNNRGRGGNKRGGRGGIKREKPNWDLPPKEVTLVGKVMHPVEKLILVKNELKDKVPIFGRPVYIKDKKKIGMTDDVLGPINDFMFSVVCDESIQPTSIKEGEKIYMNVEHFLPFERFLPKKPVQKGQKGKGNVKRGGGFRPQRGGNRGSSGGYRPPRGGHGSGGYRPPRGGKK